MQQLNTNQEDRKNSRCHGNNARHADIALVVTGISLTTTGELKNSQFSFFTSQPLYMNPTSSSLSLTSIFQLLLTAPILRRQTCMSMSCFSFFFFSQRNPNANFQNLAVQRQLPPGVLVSQKALQKEWKISFMKFFSLQKLKNCTQIWECCQSFYFKVCICHFYMVLVFISIFEVIYFLFVKKKNWSTFIAGETYVEDIGFDDSNFEWLKTHLEGIRSLRQAYCWKHLASENSTEQNKSWSQKQEQIPLK